MTMNTVHHDAYRPIEDVLSELLHCAPAERGYCAAALRAVRARFGAAVFRDVAARYFATLSPLDQQRLAVSLSVHGDSRSLAA
jgi:hypothetical protein